MARRRDDEHTGGSGGFADLLTPRRIGVVVLLTAFALWCSVNSDSVEVSFLVTSSEVPLFIALLLAGLVGAVMGFLAARRGRDD